MRPLQSGHLNCAACALRFTAPEGGSAAHKLPCAWDDLSNPAHDARFTAHTFRIARNTVGIKQFGSIQRMKHAFVPALHEGAGSADAARGAEGFAFIDGAIQEDGLANREIVLGDEAEVAVADVADVDDGMGKRFRIVAADGAHDSAGMARDGAMAGEGGTRTARFQNEHGHSCIQRPGALSVEAWRWILMIDLRLHLRSIRSRSDKA